MCLPAVNKTLSKHQRSCSVWHQHRAHDAVAPSRITEPIQDALALPFLLSARDSLTPPAPLPEALRESDLDLSGSDLPLDLFRLGLLCSCLTGRMSLSLQVSEPSELFRITLSVLDGLASRGGCSTLALLPLNVITCTWVEVVETLCSELL